MSLYTDPRSFVRNRGKRIRQACKDQVREALYTCGLKLEEPCPSDPGALFPVSGNLLTMEIGFGGGEHLIARLQEDKTRLIVGCEAYVAGIAWLLTDIDPAHLARLRLYHGDARDVLIWLPEASLDGVDLLYPDPWPKARHNKRRFISLANLDRLARVIKPGGWLHFATDIDDYADWGLRLVLSHGAFDWLAKKSSDWLEPFAGWPGTRYEAKAKQAGRVPTYLTFFRNEAVVGRGVPD